MVPPTPRTDGPLDRVDEDSLLALQLVEDDAIFADVKLQNISRARRHDRGARRTEIEAFVIGLEQGQVLGV